MAVVYLRKVAPILEKAGAMEVAHIAMKLATKIDQGIETWGKVVHREFGEIYAYEVDGFGSSCIMDDPNVPSLLSLPYLGYVSVENEIYKNTRALVLSEWNAFYAEGKVACGITSPHVGVCDKFWPMATILQGLTSTNEAETFDCLKILRKTHANTFFVHESVHVDDPHHFSRHWFSWANSLFGELILDIHKRNPELLQRSYD
jgi:hypothetical protein